ncbi:hypothetical protein SS50377_25132 [Spironucleus salmonicida]|uniref:Uncharacterized protein n=1 Tax=Spironucleus salmonicida TaxID=348837 RepID=A0A9P8LRR9_9EUKA|nr:hypothetical protein SS50377_25132 [Spironucleus salmonicida]
MRRLKRANSRFKSRILRQFTILQLSYFDVIFAPFRAKKVGRNAQNSEFSPKMTNLAQLFHAKMAIIREKFAAEKTILGA